MSGDSGHLQRLTDEQVESRLKAYSDGGRFQEAMRWLWDQAGDIIEDTTRKHFGDQVAKLNRDHFTKPVNQSWVRATAEQGVVMYSGKLSVPEFIAAHCNMAREVISKFDERFEGRTEEKLAAIDTFNRALAYAEDIVLAQIALLEANAAADARGRQSEQFERRVSELVRASTDQSKSLTERTRASGRRAVGSRNARSRPDRRRPDPRHRGCPLRGRGRSRRCYSRR
jgi:methyl-accepting chemotaxis protein